MKQRKYYEKPSEKRVREQAEAVRRARKLARKQAQREGLLAKPVARTGRPGKPGGRPGEPSVPRRRRRPTARRRPRGASLIDISSRVHVRRSQNFIRWRARSKPGRLAI